MPCGNPSLGTTSVTWRTLRKIRIRPPALQSKSDKMGKDRGTYLSIMPRQTDHRESLELLQSRPLIGVNTYGGIIESFKNTDTAKGHTNLPETNALIFSTAGSAKSCHCRSVKTTNKRKCLLVVCDDWEVSANFPESDCHSSIIKETRLWPDIVIHSTSTQQLIKVKLTIT